MKRKSISTDLFPSLKTLLIWFIGLSLAYSLFLDYRQWPSLQRRNLGQALAFEKLLGLEKGGHMNAKELTAFYNYFHAFIMAEPAWSDARSLTGFCAYHLGQKDKALEAYLKAASEQEYVGFYYNAGAIYFEKGQYREALAMFQKALSVKIGKNMPYIEQARVFKFLLMRFDPLDPSLSVRLKRYYVLSAYFSSECMQKLGSSSEAKMLREKSLEIGDFGQEKMKKPAIFLF